MNLPSLRTDRCCHRIDLPIGSVHFLFVSSFFPIQLNMMRKFPKHLNFKFHLERLFERRVNTA